MRLTVPWNHPSLRFVAIILAICFYVVILQGARGLYSSDEGRYTIVALQMLDDGDWAHPKLGPDTPIWSKPPLTYWAIAGSIGLCGRHEFAARLPNSIAWLGVLALLWRVGKTITPSQPWKPALIQATLIFPIVAANVVTTDTLLTLWTTLQLVAFIEVWWGKDNVRQNPWVRVFWLGVALGFLTKGPPALLMAASCLVFAWDQKKLSGLRQLLRFDGLAVFLVVGCAWYGYVISTTPGLLHYYLQTEIVDRTTSDQLHRNAEWYGGFKIYVPALLVGLLPWWPIVAAHLYRRRQFIGASTNSAFERFLLFAFAIPFVVFMLVRSRLPLYILPLFPPFSCYAALVTQNINPRAASLRALGILWITVVVVGILFAANRHSPNDDRLLARELSGVAPVQLSAVGLVQTTPRYGLRFYDDANVVALNLPTFDGPIGSMPLNLVRFDHGCTALLVSSWNTGALINILQSQRRAFRQANDTTGFSVLLEGDNCRG